MTAYLRCKNGPKTCPHNTPKHTAAHYRTPTTQQTPAKPQNTASMDASTATHTTRCRSAESCCLMLLHSHTMWKTQQHQTRRNSTTYHATTVQGACKAASTQAALLPQQQAAAGRGRCTTPAGPTKLLILLTHQTNKCPHTVPQQPQMPPSQMHKQHSTAQHQAQPPRLPKWPR